MIANGCRALSAFLLLAWIYLATRERFTCLEAFAIVAGGFFVLKTLATVGGFVIAALANRNDPVGFRVHPMRLLYGFLEESWVTTRGVLELMPWRSLQTLPSPKAVRAHALPVLFIHGFVCNRGYWIPTAQKSVARGFVTQSITLEPAFGSIEHYPALIESAIAELKAKTGKKQVVLVCHSMGGLAARAYLRAHGDASVRHVITVGTPHDGTVSAQLGFGENARQMERENTWRKALAQSESPALYTKFTTIYSRIDNIVAPARTGVLPGAKEIELDDVGHVAMATAPRCVNIVLDEIERVARV